MKKPFSFNSGEKVVLIQPSRKSRTHSTQVKKPSSFNPGEKPFPFNTDKKQSSFNSGEKPFCQKDSSGTIKKKKGTFSKT
jgi:hypothetical protein